jgi:hypothetical protein
MPRCIVYHPLLEKHKDEIKVQIVWYNSIEYVCPIFVLPIDPQQSKWDCKGKAKVFSRYWEFKFLPFKQQTYCHGYEGMFLQNLNFFFLELDYVLIVKNEKYQEMLV